MEEERTDDGIRGKGNDEGGERANDEEMGASRNE